MTDQNQIVYGFGCSWWDSIDKAGVKEPEGLPCCPHCGSVLLQVDEETWNRGVDKETTQNDPRYREFIKWSRGKCFPSIRHARQAFDKLALHDGLRDLKTNNVGEVVHNLTNPKTGRTYREDNLQRQHKIPIGTLVEIRHDLPQLEDGFRLHVVQHTRDCDGEPLYSLGRWGDDEDERGHACLTALNDHGYPPKLIWHGCGYGEESLIVVDESSSLPCSKEDLEQTAKEYVTKVDATGHRLCVEIANSALPLHSLVGFGGPYQPPLPPLHPVAIEVHISDEDKKKIDELIHEMQDPTAYSMETIKARPDYASMWSDLKAAIDSAEYPVMQELVKVIEMQHGVEEASHDTTP